jgi:predicted small metal-binding protein
MSGTIPAHAEGDKVMAKVLKCRDVGVDCDFVVRGATVEEILVKAEEHARKDHGYSDIPTELAEKVKAAIQEEEAAAG